MPDDRKPHLTQDVDLHAAEQDHPSRPSRDQSRHRRRADETGDDPRFPARSLGDPARIRRLALDIARNLADDRCEHVVVLDVAELSQVADYIVVGSGTSQRQMSAALDHVIDIGKQQDAPAWRTSKDERTTWLLADFVDVVVHLFEPNTRAHYDLEMLWGDAQRVDWRAELGLPRGYPAHADAQDQHDDRPDDPTGETTDDDGGD